MNVKQIGEEIASDLMYEYDQSETISDDRLEKECYGVIYDIKDDIKYEVQKELKKYGYEYEE